MARVVAAPFLLPLFVWKALWAETPESPPPRSWGVKEGLLMYVVWYVGSIVATTFEAGLSDASLEEVLESPEWIASQVAGWIAALLFAWQRLRRRRMGWVDFGFRPFDAERAFRLLAVGVMSVFCFIPILMLVVRLVVPAFEPKEPYLPEIRTAVKAGGEQGRLALVMAVVVGPLFEEIACRGFLFTALARRGAGRAAFLSTVVFALAHVQPNAMVGAFVFGLVACALYWKLGSLWPPLIVHASWNAAKMLI